MFAAIVKLAEKVAEEEALSIALWRVKSSQRRNATEDTEGKNENIK